MEMKILWFCWWHRDREVKALCFSGSLTTQCSSPCPSEPFGWGEQNADIFLGLKGRGHLHTAVRLPAKLRALHLILCTAFWHQDVGCTESNQQSLDTECGDVVWTFQVRVVLDQWRSYRGAVQSVLQVPQCAMRVVPPRHLWSHSGKVLAWCKHAPTHCYHFPEWHQWWVGRNTCTAWCDAQNSYKAACCVIVFRCYQIVKQYQRKLINIIGLFCIEKFRFTDTLKWIRNYPMELESWVALLVRLRMWCDILWIPTYY